MSETKQAGTNGVTEAQASPAKKTAMEKKIENMAGMTRQDFADATATQVKFMPQPRTIPKSHQAIAKKIGWILYKAEEIRIKVRVLWSRCEFERENAMVAE